MDKLIVTAAITGSRITRQQTPHIPILPDEIADSAVEAANAGAAIVHIHVRDPQTGTGTQDVALFKEVVENVRARCDVVLCLTTSGIPGQNLPCETRMASLELSPELASFDAGSMNLGGLLFANPPDFLELMARRMLEKGVKPELEIFDAGMIGNCLALADKDVLKKPFHFQFVLGAPGGSPGTVKSLVHMLDMIPPGSTWSVAGIGRAQLPLALASMALGGHVRVGLEDNIYFSRGVLARSNAELVSRVVRIAREAGREPATPKEARAILGLKQQESANS
jgi:3-keto-5-aminohexanoate cleavage enzyme